MYRMRCVCYVIFFLQLVSNRTNDTIISEARSKFVWHFVTFQYFMRQTVKYVVCIPFRLLVRFWSKIGSVNIKLCMICLQTRTHSVSGTFRSMLTACQNQMRAILQCNKSWRMRHFIFNFFFFDW